MSASNYLTNIALNLQAGLVMMSMGNARCIFLMGKYSALKKFQEIIITTGVPSIFGGADIDMGYFECHIVLDKSNYLLKEVCQLSKSGKNQSVITP
ncbi:TPA: hypothetical protein ACH1TY_002272 [Enterobacter mori]